MAGLNVYFGGGLNDNPECHPAEAFTGYPALTSINFDLAPESTAFQSRAPMTLVGTCPKAVRGLMQLIKRDDTFTSLVQGNDTVYKWTHNVGSPSSSTFSSMGTCATSSRLRGAYWGLDDFLVITDLDKSTVISKWDGTTFSTLTTGLGSSLYAKYAIAHLGRMWLFNVKTTTDTPHLLVASAFENPTSYDTTNRAGSATFTSGTEAFYMTTPDLRPINGVALFYETLIISTSGGRIYKLTGTDSTDFAWVPFYAGSFNKDEESMVNIGNDILFVNSGGQVESLKSTDRYGEVAVDDISRWIPSTARAQNGGVPGSPITVMSLYDRRSQRVYFFQRDNGVSGVNQNSLVLFKEVLEAGAPVGKTGGREKVSPWSVHSYTTTTAVQAVASMAFGYKDATYPMIGCASGRILMLGYSLNLAGGTESASGFTVRRVTRIFDGDTSWPQDVIRGEFRYGLRYGGLNGSATTATSSVSATVTPYMIGNGLITNNFATVPLYTDSTGLYAGFKKAPFTLQKCSGGRITLLFENANCTTYAIHEMKLE